MMGARLGLLGAFATGVALIACPGGGSRPSVPAPAESGSAGSAAGSGPPSTSTPPSAAPPSARQPPDASAATPSPEIETAAPPKLPTSIHPPSSEGGTSPREPPDLQPPACPLGQEAVGWSDIAGLIHTTCGIRCSHAKPCPKGWFCLQGADGPRGFCKQRE